MQAQGVAALRQAVLSLIVSSKACKLTLQCHRHCMPDICCTQESTALKRLRALELGATVVTIQASVLHRPFFQSLSQFNVRLRPTRQEEIPWGFVWQALCIVLHAATLPTINAGPLCCRPVCGPISASMPIISRITGPKMCLISGVFMTCLFAASRLLPRTAVYNAQPTHRFSNCPGGAVRRRSNLHRCAARRALRSHVTVNCSLTDYRSVRTVPGSRCQSSSSNWCVGATCCHCCNTAGHLLWCKIGRRHAWRCLIGVRHACAYCSAQQVLPCRICTQAWLGWSAGVSLARRPALGFLLCCIHCCAAALRVKFEQGTLDFDLELDLFALSPWPQVVWNRAEWKAGGWLSGGHLAARGGALAKRRHARAVVAIVAPMRQPEYRCPRTARRCAADVHFSVPAAVQRRVHDVVYVLVGAPGEMLMRDLGDCVALQHGAERKVLAIYPHQGMCTLRGRVDCIQGLHATDVSYITQKTRHFKNCWEDTTACTTPELSSRNSRHLFSTCLQHHGESRVYLELEHCKQCQAPSKASHLEGQSFQV